MSLFSGYRKNKELEGLLEEIGANLANNYKDAAQEALQKFEVRLGALEQEGKLKDRQREVYEERLAQYQKTLEGFTHKAQKPYWSAGET